MSRTLAVTLLSSLSLTSIAATPPCPSRSFALPTATEVFNLRSKCTALGDKIMNDNFIGSALAQEVETHYNPSTNRCYVELDVHTADLSKRPYRLTKYLYDGQTKELLAEAKVNGESDKDKSGMVFDGAQHKSTSDANAGFDDANDYIMGVMADDRKE